MTESLCPESVWALEDVCQRQRIPLRSPLYVDLVALLIEVAQLEQRHQGTVGSRVRLARTTAEERSASARKASITRWHRHIEDQSRAIPDKPR